MQSIENNFLKIQVKNTGAELSSLFNKETNTELLWQGNPEFWNGQAPILFPIIGNLKKNAYTHQGKAYELNRHGFARRSEDWNIEKIGNAAIKCTLQSNEASFKIYPFPFVLEVTYSINNKSLKIHHKITNTGTETLPCSIGGHTAYNCEINNITKHSDYSLVFEKTENEVRHFINNDGLLTGKTETVLHNSNKLQLSETLFNEDALIFKTLESNTVSLVGPKGELLNVDFSEFPYIGIWAAPKAPFVCIEPWIGHADTIESSQNLFDKEGSLAITANNSFEASYSISLS